MAVKLSICIPTFNRAPLLDQLLASIASQVAEIDHGGLEICISDNASSDGTAEIVEGWRAKLPISVIYGKNPENMGADRNYLKAVELASGEFCWFIGSDDRLEPGALRHVINRLDSHPDRDLFVLTQNVYNYNFSVQEAAQFHPLLRHEGDVLYFDTLDVLKDSGYILGYLSVLLFRRSKWEQTTGYMEVVGTAYVHTFRLLMMLRNGGGAMYVRQPVVGYRGGNDSFLDDLKLLGRFQIDIQGYDRIPALVFGEHSAEHRAMAYHGVRIFCYIHLRRLIFEHPPFAVRRAAFILAVKHFWSFPIFWMKIAPLFFVPASLVRNAKKLVLRLVNVQSKKATG